ncbi:MAG: hypothetical protein P8181_14380 [bacterium]
MLPQDFEKRFVPLDEQEEKTLIREGAVGYLQELEAHMKKNGIRAAIRFHGGVPGTCPSKTVYGLYVAAADEAAAKELDHAYWLKGAPENAKSFRYDEEKLAGTCPACASPVPEGAAECPECGLAVIIDGDAAARSGCDAAAARSGCDAAVNDDEDAAECPDCGAVVGYEVKRCPNCGVEFE